MVPDAARPERSDRPGWPVRTKIVATLGPATDDPAVVRALVRAGMSVARLNFSHGNHDEHARRIRWVREAAAAEGVPVAVLQDLQGPRLRLGAVAAGTWLAAGATFVLDGRVGPGDASGARVSFAQRVARAVRPGHRVLIDDGHLALVVRAAAAGRVETQVLVGGPLGSRKGVNLPDTPMRLPSLTDKDRADVRFGLDQGVDYLALSFVSSAAQVRTLQALVRREGGDVPVVAKIERPSAVEALEPIVAQANAVMVARGDLALEIGAARVPVAQKAIIRAANAAGVPVITATQMLESMIHSPTPTRAETSDVANAILDGSDAVMLSGETAIGRYPVEAVAEMATIAAVAESMLAFERLGRRGAERARGSVTHAISEAAVDIARRVDAAAIVASTSTGLTARAVSHHRPQMPLIGATRSAATSRRLALVWGVLPVEVEDFASTEDMVRVVSEAALRLGVVAEGDRIVIISGTPIGVPGRTNMVQVRRAGDWRAAAEARP